MKYLVSLLGLMGTMWSISFADEQASNLTNSTEDLLKKDMYVVHAMVYQVGILTNSTDDDEAGANGTERGQQEALTLFRTNGSNVDLARIPQPIRNIVNQPELQPFAALDNTSEPLITLV